MNVSRAVGKKKNKEKPPQTEEMLAQKLSHKPQANYGLQFGQQQIPSLQQQRQQQVKEEDQPLRCLNNKN